MTAPVYPAARAVAAAVEAHFARQRAAVAGRTGLGPGIDAPAVEAIVDAGFWASLRREEGRSPKISIAYLPPALAGQALTFERRLPLTPDALTRLAPAVERPGIHLGVWRDAGELYVWGSLRTIPDLSFVLEVIEPGLLVVKYSRDEAFGKYGNVAVLRGEEVRLVDEHAARRPGGPVLLAALVGLDPPVAWLDTTNVLVRLALSMRTTGHGGALLVVPAGTRRWQSSIVWPVPYRMDPAFGWLAELVGQGAHERGAPAWEQATRRAIDGIAGLTAVDGATVLSEAYELLAFGAKIERADGSTPVEEVLVTEPVVGDTARIVAPGEIGGTRHLSAAQFVHDQRDALALVASQDGRFTIFAWSAPAGHVHAYRIETLLL